MTISILGATGHIGKVIADQFIKRGGRECILYGRRPEKLDGLFGKTKRASLTSFGQEPCDVVINCIGVGNPQVLRDNPGSVFEVTEGYDEIILDYLKRFPDTLYINMSSGSVYGAAIEAELTENFESSYQVNALSSADAYRFAKINAEVKHRTFRKFNIVDLRIFSIFTPFVDPSTTYFLSDVLRALTEKKALRTDSDDMVRDFIHPADLFALIQRVIAQKKINDVFDVYSRAPVSKSELLCFFQEKYQLEVDYGHGTVSPTGSKNAYVPKFHKAKRIGYQPRFSSLNAVEEAFRSLVPPPTKEGEACI